MINRNTQEMSLSYDRTGTYMYDRTEIFSRNYVGEKALLYFFFVLFTVPTRLGKETFRRSQYRLSPQRLETRLDDSIGTRRAQIRQHQPCHHPLCRRWSLLLAVWVFQHRQTIDAERTVFVVERRD